MAEEGGDLVADFSIWVVPGQPEAQELEDVIRTYAQRLTTPAFLPHMTVLSGVKGLGVDKMVAKLVDLADSMCPFEVEIETVTFKDKVFFQCVFGRLQLRSELTHAHVRAKQIYEVKRKVNFMPHVSLVYGDVVNEVRAEVAKELSSRLTGKHLKMDKIQLWRTLGGVETWKLVAELPLRRP